MTADIISLLAGIEPGSELAAVRTLRPQATENAQRSFAALLEPAEPGTFPLAERYAVAAFVARLHGFDQATAFYADLLGDEAPEHVAAIESEAASAAVAGPFGLYRETGLQSENAPGAAWAPTAPAALGERLAAALAHAHLLVVRPRESEAGELRKLVAAGWSADDIVSLSQLVAFLAFQLRLAWGLRALGGADLETVAAPAPSAAADSAEAAPATPLITDYPQLARPEAFTQQGLGWVPWLAPVAEEELSERQLEALVEPARAKMPYFRLLARDPGALEARTLTDLDIFFNVDGGIGRAERELAATAASRSNGCVFCASVHSAAATRESGREADVQRLLDEGVGADLGDERWNAVVAASVSLTRTPLAFGAEDVARLRATGLDDASIVDVIGGAAFFNWANRLMLSLGEPEVPARRAVGA